VISCQYSGKARWRPETLNKILQNEKYIGDALLQKTYTVDFLIKKRVKNNGIVPQYYVEISHEAIIPRDLYMQVQEEMVRRANLHSGEARKKRVYSSKYALSSIVYCPRCGDIYRRIAWNNRGKHSFVWRCVSRVEHGSSRCDAPTVQETELQEAVLKSINMALGGKDDVLVALEKNIASVLALEDEGSMESINAKLEELQKELLKRANAKKDYNDLADEIDRLRELKQNAMAGSAEREGLKQRISEMRDFLNSQLAEVRKYDEQLVRRLIEKVTVYNERFVVEFKSGTSVNVER
jgi:site-specific DNA recombinase